ncbi:MAG: phosphoenolpyruvate--protein phosphotransferase [Acetobacteraceae bacterium]|nr:phosphoenolpyruvate--protein phosphotransferase [Acetobacteraceae bacterium]
MLFGERHLIGLPACAGVAIGPVFRAVEPQPQITRNKIHAEDVAAEVARFDAAILQSRRQLLKLKGRLSVLPEESQGEIAPLLDAYLQMLGPSRLVRGVRHRVQDRLVSAETAVMEEANAVAAALLALGRPTDLSSPGPQRQADEVREIGRRLVRNLTRAPFRSYSAAPQGSILVAEALRPSDAALVDPSRIAGVATEEGGTDGHTAIILRALGIPSVLGAPGLVQAAAPDTTILVDGATGVVIIRPTSASLAAARRAVAAFARERQQLSRMRRLPAVTLDGQDADLQANLELPIELALVAQSGANGIGLLRTEFLFMNRETVPTVDEQEATYRNVIETMDGDPVTIRVLDWGGEKEIEALVAAGLVPELPDANPALGLRGVRLLLRRPELFETQLTAILRAAKAGPTRVLLPMVTNVAEFSAAREVYRRVAARMRDEGERLSDPLPPLGSMIETPGAALLSDALAGEAEFFAIGTNDLCMYTLAVDRGELDVAHLYDPLHPAVLRLIQMTAEAAQRRQIPVSVCGEMAANPSFTPLLLGLGVRSFSTNASAVPRVKQAVRSTTLDDCQRLTWQVMKQSDPARTRELLEQFGR